MSTSPFVRAAVPLLLLGLAGCSKSAANSSPTEPASTTSGEAPAASAVPAAPAELLAVGSDAPPIRTKAHDGQAVNLSELRGKPVVVYFYPKDDTPGCTVEAEGIRDEWPELSKTGAIVMGVSTDDADSHRAFASKYQLPFLLLPDPDAELAKAFGVPLKNGRAKRVTFVIDKAGKIARVFPDVTPKDHAKELLDAVRALSG
ncbi:MAG: peroxiredoxin [Polyangiaceae bacterium]|nr:peroxiredoxin [Polyangiaceae bacterium]